VELVGAVCGTDPIATSPFPLEDMTSVFNFSVNQRPGVLMPRGALRRVHGWMNRSLGAFLNLKLSREETEVADQIYHLGQPVMISPGARDSRVAVLRVALGAPLLCSLVDFERGVIATERAAWLRKHLADLARKIDLILHYRDQLGRPESW
jgi:hypothetical protein